MTALFTGVAVGVVLTFAGQTLALLALEIRDANRRAARARRH